MDTYGINRRMYVGYFNYNLNDAIDSGWSGAVVKPDTAEVNY